ncbi:MAG: tetratricopeptide repeat protein [Planctomycetota bacterium]|nr:tetratricopeptide repeat protein [Planctomycetota bacterium]
MNKKLPYLQPWLLLLLVVLGHLTQTGCVDPRPTLPAEVQLIDQPSLDNLDSDSQFEIAVMTDELIDAQQFKAEIISFPELAVMFANAGDVYQAYGITDHAITCYQNAVILSTTENAVWHYQLARTLQGTDRLAEAARQFEIACRLLPKQNAPDAQVLAAFYRLGECQLALTQVTEARQSFQSALKIDNQAVFHLAIGHTYLESEPGEAIHHFLRALESAPRASNIHYHLMMAYRKVNNLRQAKHHQQQFQQGQARVALIDPFDRALEKIKDSARAFHTRGDDALFKYGDFPAAVKYYQDALKQSPHNPTIHLNLGVALLRLGRLDEAKQHFSESLDLEPQNPLAMTNLGIIAKTRGKAQEALQWFRQAVKLGPSNHEIRLQLADSLAMAGRTAEALEQYQEIVQREPADQVGLTAMAKCYLQLQKYPEAQVHLATALSVYKDDVTLRIMNILAWTASDNPSLRDPATAQNSLELLNSTAHPVQHAAGTAMLHAANGHFEQAITAQKRAIELATTQELTQLLDSLQHNLNRYEQQQLPMIFVPTQDEL